MGDIKIGNSSITLKLGSSAVTAAYLGSTLVYSGGTPPTPSYKWLATYSDSHTESAQCDSSSAITRYEIELFGGLVSVEIGDCVTSIGSGAFDGSMSLTSIDMPSGVTTIGNYAFYYCSSLTSVTINAIYPPILGDYAFDSTNDCPIYVPSASIETYKSASGWSDYASRIQAIPNS